MDVRAFAHRRYQAWLDRRIPPADKVRLDQRRIFIFLSPAGVFFVGVFVISLLAGINYENNMAFALAFWMGGLLVTGILHTYNNLSGLELRARPPEPIFAGENARIVLELSTRRAAGHRNIELLWPSGEDRLRCQVWPREPSIENLFLPLGQRGRQRLSRLKVQSAYPLGLLNTWSWVDLAIDVLVYPKPLFCPFPGNGEGLGSGQIPTCKQGVDDFAGTRDYRPGDPLHHVHWKPVAKGLAPQSKLFVALAEEVVWLDWQAFTGMDTERRLCHLCYWAVQLGQSQTPYGLRIPGFEVGPGIGTYHQQQVLTQLALFQHGTTPSASGQSQRPTSVAPAAGGLLL